MALWFQNTSKTRTYGCQQNKIPLQHWASIWFVGLYEVYSMMVLRMRLVGYLIMKYLTQYKHCVVLTFLKKEPTSE